MRDLTKKIYVEVNGYYHPKQGGDDYPFRRGFIIPVGRTIEEFKIHFEKKVNKNSACPEDFLVTEISEKKWNKIFKIKIQKGLHY
jgi:hypothetical protein